MKLLPAFASGGRQPRPGSVDLTTLGFDSWRDAVAQIGDPALADFSRNLTSDLEGRALLAAVFGNSPFLTRCLLQDIALFRDWLVRGPDEAWQRLLDEARGATGPDCSRDALKSALRIARRRAALLTGLSDIARLWTLEQVTGRLTEFAEFALDRATEHLIRGAAAGGLFKLANAENPLDGCGFIVLGMGKLGGHELNYSSDIDLIVLYDEDWIDPADPWQLQQGLVRVTRDLVQTIEERTADGYVFRTDLRLRPDPGATPLAISVIAAETYYESMGQNWERAAMIKARPVAGDRAAGEAFINTLRPFIWRKYLDFGAIQDIHSIKRQINAHRGGGTIEIFGHNVKLGRGGIREIEFFAQTQQLIWGGREPSLRRAGTCDTLRDLATAGRITARVAEEMIDSYRFLRTVEHRLQMAEDMQTHSLPADEAGIAALGAFLGYPGADPFVRDLDAHLRRVERHYAELFEEQPSLGSSGNLVFTGGEHDPETLATLRKLGYKDAEKISSVVRAWHHGRYRATRSQRARELLTELMPALLEALAKTTNPDAAFVRFDEFLAGLPAGVQLFSLLYQNPGLLDLLAEIMGSASALAQHLSRRPSLFDAVLTAGFFEPMPGKDGLAADLAHALDQARDFQDILDIARRWTNDHKFQVGVRMLRGAADIVVAGRSLSDIADTVIESIQPDVEIEFALQHGTIQDAGMAIVAMGRLGSREMTMTSDLDLIFVYQASDDDVSDGDRPLPPSHYYTRLSQRLMNALTAPTGEGKLYEVDMRLRPSGNAGPIASSLESFITYHEEQSWTWEHMALTRARVIAGPEALRLRVEATIRATLVRQRDADRLVVDVADMRARIEREHRSNDLWQTKYVRGGLIDIEFIAQYLQLRHAAAQPDILATPTADALATLSSAGLLDQRHADTLLGALTLWSTVQGLLRLTQEGRFAPDQASDGFKALLVRATGSTDFAELEARLAQAAADVYALFRTLIEEPAARLAPLDPKKKQA
jgi:[glutamine synthetase] adenylyltransferase / [glutamine synthetase]-adenylyl-L-tyrosine phosphorylase